MAPFVVAAVAVALLVSLGRSVEQLGDRCGAGNSTGRRAPP
jgi:hypothetical protein